MTPLDLQYLPNNTNNRINAKVYEHTDLTIGNIDSNDMQTSNSVMAGL